MYLGTSVQYRTIRDSLRNQSEKCLVWHCWSTCVAALSGKPLHQPLTSLNPPQFVCLGSENRHSSVELLSIGHQSFLSDPNRSQSFSIVPCVKAVWQLKSIDGDAFASAPSLCQALFPCPSVIYISTPSPEVIHPQSITLLCPSFATQPLSIPLSSCPGVGFDCILLFLPVPLV